MPFTTSCCEKEISYTALNKVIIQYRIVSNLCQIHILGSASFQDDHTSWDDVKQDAVDSYIIVEALGIVRYHGVGGVWDLHMPPMLVKRIIDTKSALEIYQLV